MSESQKRTTISLDKDLKAKLDVISERSGFSIPEIMKQIIEILYPFSENCTRISLITVPSKSGCFIGIFPMSFGVFQMPTNASDSEVDAEVKKRIEEDFEGEK
jgi:hypothetical protein